MLLRAAGHQIVGSTPNGDELITLLSAQSADVAILDIRMLPEPDGGLITAERLRATYPELGLLFLSHYADTHYLMRILEIGTERIGYRLKEKVGSVDVLTDTLSRIHAGEIVIEPVLAKRLVDRPRAEKKRYRSDAFRSGTRGVETNGRGEIKQWDRRSSLRHPQGS